MVSHGQTQDGKVLAYSFQRWTPIGDFVTKVYHDAHGVARGQHGLDDHMHDVSHEDL